MGCTSSSQANAVGNGQKPQQKQQQASSPAEFTQKSSSSSSLPSSSARKFSSFYTLGEKLGEGTYSVVRIAVRKSDGMKVAVKMVNRTGMSEEDQKSLLREVEIMKSLDHPNIVKVLDFFSEETDYYYLVLEYLAGGELFERLAEKTVYTEREAREIALVLFKAIKFIHDKDIVHRDIKPENILLTSKDEDTAGGIKITDFGFAASLTASPGGQIKQQAGTPGYVSPEVLERKPHGKPVDLWAMGVVLYMLLGGYPPFYSSAEEDSRAMYRRILLGNYQFHAEYWGSISSEAKDLIAGLLTVDPNKRLTVEQVLTHPWLFKASTELAVINLERNLALLRDYRSSRIAAQLGAIATNIAIDVARKVSHRGSMINTERVAVEVIRKISNSNLNDLARRAAASSNTSSSDKGRRSPTRI